METTPHGGQEPAHDSARSWPAGVALDRFLEHVPTAILVTRGPRHVLVSANVAGRQLLEAQHAYRTGRALGDLLAAPGAVALVALLDQAYRAGVVVRDRGIQPMDGGATPWCCSVWPQLADDGPAHLLVELRATPEPDTAIALQRRVAERTLLSALRELARADDADAARQRATFLAAAGQRLAGSLDPTTTEREVRRTALPHPGGWCIVDLVDEEGAMHRLSIVHPDPLKQALARQIEDAWAPVEREAFGIAAMLRASDPVAVDAEVALASGARSPETRRIVAELGMGPMLTVPLHIGGRLAGALTFVSGAPAHEYTDEDFELAQALAVRSAMALDSARRHAAAVAHSQRAELASRAKTIFLGNMSHELRTPLNAIAGYVDLIDMGLRGPVTELQRADLARVRLSLQHLVALITNVLSLVRVDEGVTTYHITAVPVDGAVGIVVDMLEPLLRQKGLACEVRACGPEVAAHADPEKVTQILVNLVANAIKFTAPGGRVTLSTEASAHAVGIHVEDTGIGIAPEAAVLLFEPFVQVHGRHMAGDAGTGLGLAISRALARGMGGNLTVRSTLGEGSRFTLSLPRTGA